MGTTWTVGQASRAGPGPNMRMKMDRRLVTPGEAIGESSQHSAGHGVEEEGGSLYATTLGYMREDEPGKLSVEPLNPPRALREGDVVYGIVTALRGSLANIDLAAVDGSGRGITGERMGTLHITKVKQAYTSSISENMRLGDIVRASVVQVRPSLQLSTARADLGVVRARCTKCRSFLIREGEKLYCQECGALEHRKLSNDYGEVTINE